MRRSNNVCRIETRAQRHGIALVAVIVLATVSLTLFGLWARAGIRERQRLANQRLRLQAVLLAEAGLRRGLALRASDPQYQEETWSLPAESLDGTHAAEVRIRVTPSDDATAVRYEATAVFPVAAARRAQVTKRIELPTIRERG